MINSQNTNPTIFSKTLPTSIGCSTQSSIEPSRWLIACITVLLAFPISMHAQQDLPWRSNVWDEDFTTFSPAGRFLGTHSTHDAASGTMILTPEARARSGRLFFTRLLPVSYFDLSFRARFGVNASFNESGADGIVAVLAAVYDYPPTGGGALNFDGCLGYGLEFDTYQNPDRNDPSPEHIAIIKDRSDNHLHHETLVVPTLEDGAWHEILIRFRNGYIEAWLDGTRRLNRDIPGFFPFDGFFGFSSATGSAYNEHRIDDIRLSLPTRAATDFGAWEVCDTIDIDTVLFVRNNHPDNLPFTVTDIRLTGGAAGVFSLLLNPVPAVLPAGGRIALPVHVHLATPGDFTAILELTADNGERIQDTLRISGDIPRLRFDPATAAFPVTRAGATRDIDVLLRNEGMLPVLLEGLQLRGSAFAVISPSAFPVSIAVGETLPVRLRFSPATEGTYADTLTVTNTCGVFEPLPLTGVAMRENIAFSFTPASLLLQPVREGEVLLRLDSLPRFTAVTRIDGNISFEFAVVAFLDHRTLPLALPPGSTVLTRPLGLRTIAFTVSTPSPLTTPGDLFALRFGANTYQPTCTPLRLESIVLNGDTATADAPDLITRDGRICVNPSCRHPEGLYAITTPSMRVTPHPATTGSQVLLTLEEAGSIELLLRDVLGRTRKVLVSGDLKEGTHSFGFPADGLTDGCYLLDLRWNGGRIVKTIVFR
jgi:hypothetical protein